VYRRQPPSLRDLALDTVHTLGFDVAKFKLTREVFFQQYYYACGFIVAGDVTSFLHPDFSHISVDCRFVCYELHKFHRGCVTASDSKTSRIRINSEFRDALEAVVALLNGRQRYFCSRCDKSLFYDEVCDTHEFP
jgi:hypothetical protein